MNYHKLQLYAAYIAYISSRRIWRLRNRASTEEITSTPFQLVSQTTKILDSVHFNRLDQPGRLNIIISNRMCVQIFSRRIPKEGIYIYISKESEEKKRENLLDR